MKNNFAVYRSILGPLLMEYEEGKITLLRKSGSDTVGAGNPTSLTDDVFIQLEEYFAGQRRIFSVPLELHGTDFQMEVWKALLDIPYGHTKTYGEIACAVGNSKACRAVGMACNRNPIAIIVPCHRVIGFDGELTGYAGGIMMKRMLLDIERRETENSVT
ncbi:MAG: methylated-DNA--[protein]-cysteine S-methyltransferase [Bacteroidales bacterium]|jgi:O-6-methylguanine DNA methyltransferase|nr:methylated-DNA--[protein]-cysteine S-methyltransferase [Bacteroidales bacterium]MCI2121502.1 methylated-DNA--[protein]-cysteine S-methyltransferase [Bacteroidales bacterium]MCI2145133.1 methylated-DNA--[protein]-cysteine S-methyltransferase [Bacteroidales bacterium]